jgi:tetratricopeptide (TPR) repeat protein
MGPRNPRRRRGRTLGSCAALVAAALAGAVGRPVGRADPAPPASDLTRARELYRAAEAEMQAGRFDDAVRDYGAAYELSADPALLFKLGHAHERAGNCPAALAYYARYLREGKPGEPFIALTRAHIAACGGGAGAPGNAGGSAGAPGGSAGSAAATTGGSAGSPGGSAMSGSEPAPAGAGSGEAVAGSGSAAPTLVPPTREKVAWLLGGGGLALATLGGVLAYAARSSENDVRDLYAGFAGRAPTFDGATRKRYDDLVNEGRQYQHLAWAAFGLAGAAAAGAVLLFTVDRGDEPAPRPAPAITPVIGPGGAGVSVRF